MSSSFKHQKKRNIGLVYEFLTREMTSKMIDRDRPGAELVMNIMKKHFSGGILRDELDIFNTIQESRGQSESIVRQIITEASRESKKLDQKLLDIKKSNLIKDVHHSFGRDFFDKTRLSEYRFLASIQIFLDSSRKNGRRIDESLSMLKLEESLVNFLVSKPARPFEGPNKNPKGIDLAIVTMASKRFSERYKNTLNKKQRKLLDSYLRFLVDHDERPIRDKIKAESAEILRDLKEALLDPDVIEDSVLTKRMNEVAEKLQERTRDAIDDLLIEDMLLYQKLHEEVTNDE